MQLRRRSSSGAISFEAFGVAVEVGYSAAALEPRVRALLPPGWTAPHGTGLTGRFDLEQETSGDYTVSFEGRPLITGATLDLALAGLDTEIRTLVMSLAPGLLFVHAGVVALGQRALLMPGGSFIGKTTLVRSLVQAGAVYYSDEYAVLDQDGNVQPYPRPLSVAGGVAGGVVGGVVGEPNGVVARPPVEVGAVMITRYRPRAEWSPQTLSPGAGVLALMENTTSARLGPQETLVVLARALRGARVWLGDRGEADDAAKALITAMAR